MLTTLPVHDLETVKVRKIVAKVCKDLLTPLSLMPRLPIQPSVLCSTPLRHMQPHICDRLLNKSLLRRCPPAVFPRWTECYSDPSRDLTSSADIQPRG